MWLLRDVFVRALCPQISHVNSVVGVGLGRGLGGTLVLVGMDTRHTLVCRGCTVVGAGGGGGGGGGGGLLASPFG